jgi:hypothetical protein
VFVDQTPALHWFERVQRSRYVFCLADFDHHLAHYAIRDAVWSGRHPVKSWCARLVFERLGRSTSVVLGMMADGREGKGRVDWAAGEQRIVQQRVGFDAQEVGYRNGKTGVVDLLKAGSRRGADRSDAVGDGSTQQSLASPGPFDGRFRDQRCGDLISTAWSCAPTSKTILSVSLALSCGKYGSVGFSSSKHCWRSGEATSVSQMARRACMFNVAESFMRCKA